MKTKYYIYSQPNHLTSRVAIAREQKQFIKIAFAVHLSAVISAERYRSDSEALKSAVSSTSVLPCTDVDSKFCIRKTCKLEPPPSLAELIVVYFYILCNIKKGLGFLRAEPLSSNFEDRRGYRGGKKVLSDKSVFPPLKTAPIDDEAKKHNENLPGMGGVYNTVNLHVYHYAGNNPVKYTDPDGRDIHILTLGGVGAKLIIGGSFNIGIAWDDNGNSALVMTGGFGVGIEAQLHSFITPSYSVTKGKNIDDLPGLGSTRISFSASLTGTEANVGIGIGINFDMESNEISGFNAGIIGGGVNFIGFARFKIINHGEKSRSAEQLKEVIDTIKNLDTIPDNIKQEMLKTIKEMM